MDKRAVSRNVFGLLVGAVIVAVVACAGQAPSWSLVDLQGAWWSDPENSTADFAISGEEIWLDDDAGYHPCRIENRDTLVYDAGPDPGTIERRIVSLAGDLLILEFTTPSGERRQTTYHRESP